MTEKIISFRRLSISNKGITLDVIQAADTLSEALAQEFDYYKKVKRIPAEILIQGEEED